MYSEFGEEFKIPALMKLIKIRKDGSDLRALPVRNLSIALRTLENYQKQWELAESVMQKFWLGFPSHPDRRQSKVMSLAKALTLHGISISKAYVDHYIQIATSGDRTSDFEAL